MVTATPYPGVNEVLDLVLSGSSEILEKQFIGMYLYGSLASGDFDPECSDIDFVVITAQILPEEIASKLEIMHKRIWATGLLWAEKLEGSYIPVSLIRRHDPSSPPCPTVNEGNFFVDERGSDWIIQRHIIREHGVVLGGPDPKTLIDPVSPDDIRGAVLGILREWWFPMLEDSAWLRERGSNYHVYTVMTMCRALYAVKHGTIVSKPVAIQWAKIEFSRKWHKLFDRVVASQYGEPTDFLNETLEFINFTKERISK